LQRGTIQRGTACTAKKTKAWHYENGDCSSSAQPHAKKIWCSWVRTTQKPAAEEKPAPALSSRSHRFELATKLPRREQRKLITGRALLARSEDNSEAATPDSNDGRALARREADGERSQADALDGKNQKSAATKFKWKQVTAQEFQQQDEKKNKPLLGSQENQ
jgi:hypothetical protein